MDTRIEQILSDVLGYEMQQNREYLYFCPFCHHHKKKLSVNTTTLKWKCWVCGVSGAKLTSLLWKIGATKQQIKEVAEILTESIRHIPEQEYKDTNIKLPVEYIPLWKSSTLPMYKKSLAYLETRGIGIDEIITYQLGFCDVGMYHGRVIVPSFNVDGSLNYFVGRSIFTSNFPYLAPSISKNFIGFENQLNWNHPIIICEGAFDAIAIKRNAIPLFGKYISKKLQESIITKEVRHIYLALDIDALEDSVKIAEKMLKAGRNVHVLDMKDKDPSVMGFEKITNLIDATESLDFSTFVQLKMGIS